MLLSRFYDRAVENENIHVIHITVPDDQNEQSTENVRIACLIKRGSMFL